MEKRLALAIGLSILVIVVFQNFVAKNQPIPTATAPVVQEAQSVLSKESEMKALPSEALRAEEKEYEVETDKYIVVFSNIGGAIKSIKLKEYRDVKSGEPLILAETKNPNNYIFSISDPLYPTALSLSPYTLEKSKDAVSYSYKTKDLEITKKYYLHNINNGIELELIVKNISSAPITFAYNIIGGSGIREQEAPDKRFIEVMSKIDGKIFNFKHPKDKKLINQGIVSWTALKNKYFCIIMKPFIDTKAEFYSQESGDSFLTGVTAQDVVIQPNSIIDQKFILYAGPSKIAPLKTFGYEFEESVNYGFFGWIAKIMLVILGGIYSLLHSWGIAIIILAIFLNGLLFPLSKHSFVSMKKMQELHPQMEKLKIQCKDNPQKMNKEMMELYKKYKINPFSGCLPLLLQMPIFIALYQALMKSIDLRGAKFLWIKDLSSPDAVALPVTLPVIGNHINILPILMVIGTVVQQKISVAGSGTPVTAEQAQQQKMMLILMPIMFGFIFYSMPSGLVLYWLISTILTSTEQYLIFKKV